MGFDNNSIENLEYSTANKSMVQEGVNLATYINYILPRTADNKISRFRRIGDLNYLSCIKGNNFKINSDMLKLIYIKSYDTLVYLKENYGINYLLKDEDFNQSDNLDFYYDENSVITVFKESAEVIQECMIEYYQDRNIDLYNKMIEIYNQKEFVRDYKKALIISKDKEYTEYVSIKSIDLEDS